MTNHCLVMLVQNNSIEFFVAFVSLCGFIRLDREAIYVVRKKNVNEKQNENELESEPFVALCDPLCLRG
jgi:hypothetical protein